MDGGGYVEEEEEEVECGWTEGDMWKRRRRAQERSDLSRRSDEHYTNTNK
jgi:hypothetical protein